MSDYWKAHAQWQGDPDASLAEAERRVAVCAETRGEGLYFGDLWLEKLPAGLSRLTWLKEFRAFGGRIGDWSPLRPLSGLRVVEIGSLNCPFPGINFMAGWSDLESFDVIAPSDLDLGPLASCSKLKRFKVWSTQHQIQLLNLRTLPVDALEHVSLYGTRSDDFDVIGGWTHLTFLQLNNANLPSLDSFASLTELQHCHVSRAAFADVSPLEGLHALEEISFTDVPIRDITPLCGLPLLRSLRLSSTEVSDLSPLQQLAECQAAFHGEKRKTEQFWFRQGLETLDIGNTAVTDLGPVGHLSPLQTLDVNDTAVSSLDPLRSCAALSILNISRTAVTTLGPAGSMRNLRHLAAAETRIDNLAALAPAPSLQSIDIAGTEVVDLTPLKDAHQCRFLNLRGSRVANLDALLLTGSEHSQDHGDSRESLDFRDTPASQVDERFAELALLAEQSTEKCFHETKVYLRERAEGQARSVVGRLLGKLHSSWRAPGR